MSKPACPTCGGKGTIAREVPKLADGSPDPRYVMSRFPALCEACCGSGAVPDAKARVQNIAAARAADGG